MPCVKSGARAGSLYRNLVAHALTLGASGDRAPVRQQPCDPCDFLTGRVAVHPCLALLKTEQESIISTPNQYLSSELRNHP